MFSVSQYFERNQTHIAKQMSNLVSETATRLPASMLLIVLAGFFIDMWGFVAVAAAFMVVDDLVLYLATQHIHGPNALRNYAIIIVSNTFGVLIYSLPFGIMIFDPVNYVALSIGIMCLLIAYVQTATTRTMDLFHGIVTSLPLMLTFVAALIGLVISQHNSVTLVVVGLLTLVVAATYLFWMFIDNARLRYTLELETERANKASLAKTEFLATMSHEIRTPLNGVLGAVQLLQESKELQDDRWKFDVLLRSVDNLKSIVDDAIDVSRVEAGEFDIKNEPTDLKKMMDDVRFLFQPVAEQKGLRIDLDIATNIADQYLVAGGRIRQIAINLTSNAVKYTESGRIRLSLSEADGQLSIAVSDTGSGISEEEKGKLFDRFSRLANARNSQNEGTGLGLAISKELAEAMGGTLELRSALGQGSCFTLTVPAEKIVSNEMVIRDFSTPTDYPFSHRKILIVDDNQINRTIAREFLRKEGAHVTEAENGEAALEILRQNKIDLILLDQRMPVMDGPEMLRRLRRSQGLNSNALVVVLTAGVSDEPLKAFHGLDVAAFLSKPILKADLLDALSANLPVHQAAM